MDGRKDSSDENVSLKNRGEDGLDVSSVSLVVTEGNVAPGMNSTELNTENTASVAVESL